MLVALMMVLHIKFCLLGRLISRLVIWPCHSPTCPKTVPLSSSPSDGVGSSRGISKSKAEVFIRCLQLLPSVVVPPDDLIRPGCLVKQGCTNTLYQKVSVNGYTQKSRPALSSRTSSLLAYSALEFRPSQQTCHLLAHPSGPLFNLRVLILCQELLSSSCTPLQSSSRLERFGSRTQATLLFSHIIPVLCLT